MRTNFRTPLLAAALAAGLLLIAPAAQASSTIYPPAGACTASPTVTEPGGTFGFECEPGTFFGDENVTITVTGENGSASSVGTVRFAASTAAFDAVAQADGSLSTVSITLPSDAAGAYSIAAVSPSSSGGTAAVSVLASSGALSVTGLNADALLPLLIGGGILLLAGVALVVTAVARRSGRRD